MYEVHRKLDLNSNILREYSLSGNILSDVSLGKHFIGCLSREAFYHTERSTIVDSALLQAGRLVLQYVYNSIHNE